MCCATTLVDQPATAVAFAAIVVLATVTDLAWKHRRGPFTPAGEVATAPRPGAGAAA